MAESTADTPSVLVVEDEPELARTFTSWIGASRPVRTAEDGETALEVHDEDVDVVLLDRRLPGMSGDEVLERIRERNGDCRVAMVTAVEPDLAIADLPFDDYVVKPVTKAELESLIDRLARRATYDEHIREHFALASKLATLEQFHSRAVLADSEEYARLQDEMAALEAKLDETTRELTSEDFAALLRRDATPAAA